MRERAFLEKSTQFLEKTEGQREKKEKGRAIFVFSDFLFKHMRAKKKETKNKADRKNTVRKIASPFPIWFDFQAIQHFDWAPGA